MRTWEGMRVQNRGIRVLPDHPTPKAVVTAAIPEQSLDPIPPEVMRLLEIFVRIERRRWNRLRELQEREAS